jgi:two-component system, chemotaxis family, protein-glutamate methylesterase/glutaminase
MPKPQKRARPIRVLVIDDSLFMRQIIHDILEQDSELEVVAVAKDGQGGLEKFTQLKPDVVTMDYEMPGLNGVAVLKKIMRQNPTPVVMISAYTTAGAKVTLEALSQGAVDYIVKPSGTVSMDIETIGAEIIEKIKRASRAKPKNAYLPSSPKKLHYAKTTEKKAFRAIVIGSSTGGTTGVELITSALRERCNASIFIAQHMPKVFTELFAERLNRLARITVKEGENRERIKPSVAYVAPGGLDMSVSMRESEAVIQLSKPAKEKGMHPSIDVLMSSVANVYDAASAGVLLSGMGSDGALGMESIFKARGETIAQDEKTSVVFGMPNTAIQAGVVDRILPITLIPKHILELIA